MLVQLIQSGNDSGHAGARMGLGPATLLASGAAEVLRSAGHQVEVVRVEPRDPFPGEIAAGFRVAAELSRQVRMALRQRRFPIVLAGNCLASVGVLAGHPRGRSGIVWMDAHADFHTPETTASGFLDGMAMAVLAGHCWTGLSGSIPGFRPVAAADLLLLGAREIDAPEGERLREHGIAQLPVQRLRQHPDALREILDRLGGATDRVHLHVDLDVLDPERVGRANAFAAPGGLAGEELEEVIGEVRRRCRLASATLSAYDPSHDPGGSVRDTALRLLQALAG